MNLSATILLAFGMSMDAFAASIGKGATLHKPKFSEAVRTGLIFGAIETHQCIAVFGDFDVDGMSSTCLLTLALRDFGADVRPYIPHRFGEGYGCSPFKAVRELGSERRETVRSLSSVGVGKLREAVLALMATRLLQSLISM